MGTSLTSLRLQYSGSTMSQTKSCLHNASSSETRARVRWSDHVMVRRIRRSRLLSGRAIVEPMVFIEKKCRHERILSNISVQPAPEWFETATQNVTRSMSIEDRQKYLSEFWTLLTVAQDLNRC